MILRIGLLVILSATLAACESIETKRPELNNATAPTAQIPSALKPAAPAANPVSSTDLPIIPSSVTGSPEVPNASPMAPPPKVEQGERAKIGILLGPGGLRAYAHIGVLQELMKAKVPVVSVVGFETGALVGGIFAAKGQSNNVEWQMMKLHEEDFQKKSIMASARPQDVRVLLPFLQNALGNLTAEDAKINFACPSYNIVKRQVFMMSRGPMVSMLPYCTPFVPFYKPYEQSIAALTSLTAAIKYMKSKGANYLIYVDLLGQKTVPFFTDTDSDENVEWSTVAEALEAQLSGVNKVITVPLNGLFINDFSQRREMTQRGQEAGLNAGREITNELGL